MDANLFWQRSIVTGQYQCQRQCQSRCKVSSCSVVCCCSVSLFQVTVPSVFMANTVIFGANTMVLRKICFFLAITVVFEANLVVFCVNIILFWAHTLVLGCNTVVSGGKYSHIFIDRCHTMLVFHGYLHIKRLAKILYD